MSRAARLQGWIIGDTQREGLDISFSAPPEGLSWPEAVRSVFSLSRRDAGRAAIDTPWLVLDTLSLPAALRFPFRRLDEVGIRALRLEGPTDFAIQIVHPDGPILRSLTFALRAGTAPKGRREEPALEAIRAERNGDPVALTPAPPPAPRLASGIYDLEVKLRPEGLSGVRVHLSVRRATGTGTVEVYSSDSGEGILLPGSDWNRGLVCLWPSSPLLASSAAVRKIVTVGLLDHEREMSRYPFEAAEGEDGQGTKEVHGEADRR